MASSSNFGRKDDKGKGIAESSESSTGRRQSGNVYPVVFDASALQKTGEPIVASPVSSMSPDEVNAYMGNVDWSPGLVKNPPRENKEPIDATPVSFLFPEEANIGEDYEEPIDATPLSFAFPQDAAANGNLYSMNRRMKTLNISPPSNSQATTSEATPVESSSKQRKKRALTASVKLIDCKLDFKLTDEERQYIEKMDVARSEAARTNPVLQVRTSLPQRLGGWLIEERERKNGLKIRDKYCCYQPAMKSFRSILEIESFIKFEIFPNQRPPSDRKSSKETSASGTKNVPEQIEDESFGKEHLLSSLSNPEDKPEVNKVVFEELTGMQNGDTIVSSNDKQRNLPSSSNNVEEQ